MSSVPENAKATVPSVGEMTALSAGPDVIVVSGGCLSTTGASAVGASAVPPILPSGPVDEPSTGPANPIENTCVVVAACASDTMTLTCQPPVPSPGVVHVTWLVVNEST